MFKLRLVVKHRFDGLIALKASLLLCPLHRFGNNGHVLRREWRERLRQDNRLLARARRIHQHQRNAGATESGKFIRDLGRENVLSATKTATLNCLSFSITVLFPSAGFTVMLQVLHHLAEKSTMIGRFADCASATALRDHGCHR